MKIGLIGIGKMNGAILNGLASHFPAKDIFISTRSKDKLASLKELYRVNTGDNSYVACEADIIILGVKPYLIKDVLMEIKDYIKDKIIVSIAAAITISDIEEIVGDKKIVRVMPNTSLEIGSGVCGISFNNKVDKPNQQLIMNIFDKLGTCYVIDESNMNALTALSGSGPAYAYMFIEALADGAVLNGLPREISYKLACDTIIGAANMMRVSKRHPGELKDDVCSPKGSTIEAIRALEKTGFRSSVIEAEIACFEKLERMASSKK